jgi:hypothetical protein
MGQLSTRQFAMNVSTRGYEWHTAGEWLYKHDHPRDIDRHIDFFGDGLSRAEADADGCGEVFLESLA